MRKQYQGGYIRRARRSKGPDAWEFLWRQADSSGKYVRRTLVIGTTEKFPTKELASEAINGVRARINQISYRERVHPITVAHLLDHYVQTELRDRADSYKESTKRAYRDVISNWIRPRWTTTSIYEMHPVDVEGWFADLRRKDGSPLADGTKSKIRSTMKTIFNHAIRYEWLDKGTNPIETVRQKGVRKRKPDVLDYDEIARLLSELNQPYSLMAYLAITTGMRRCELIALKWYDINFLDLKINVRRAICNGVVDSCKTLASERVLPLDFDVAKELRSWEEQTRFSAADDWVFASPHSKGKFPYWPGGVLKNHFHPAAQRAGIAKNVGWHTFRHTFSTLLDVNRTPTKAIQTMMGHASEQTTRRIYIHFPFEEKRKAQRQLVLMIKSCKRIEPLNYEEKMSASDAAECDGLRNESSLM
jgi:integrase